MVNNGVKQRDDKYSSTNDMEPHWPTEEHQSHNKTPINGSLGIGQSTHSKFKKSGNVRDSFNNQSDFNMGDGATEHDDYEEEYEAFSRFTGGHRFLEISCKSFDINYI